MELAEEICTNNKWALLQLIAEEPQTPSALALKTHTSISNVVQQLKLLEAYNIVTHERAPLQEPEQKTTTSIKSRIKNSGKPKNIYTLTTQTIYMTILRKGFAQKKTIKLDSNNILLFTTIATTNSEDAFFILKFMMTYEDLIKKTKAIGFLKSTRESIELFIISDHLEELRSKFSNIFVQDLSGKTKKIVNWSHNEYEITDGLHRSDPYFVGMIKTVTPLYDPKELFKTLTKTRAP